MHQHPHPFWGALVGARVDIRRAGAVVDTGTVEAVTPDGSLLWLAADGPTARRMVMRADGSEAWVSYNGTDARSPHRGPASPR